MGMKQNKIISVILTIIVLSMIVIVPYKVTSLIETFTNDGTSILKISSSGYFSKWIIGVIILSLLICEIIIIILMGMIVKKFVKILYETILDYITTKKIQ